MLNNWSLGGLLLYFGHPSVRVSIDSRADPYPFSYFQRHQRALVGPPGELRAFVAAYAIDAIVLGRPIYDGIRHNLSVLPGFRTAFVDDRTAVLLREAGGGRR